MDEKTQKDEKVQELKEKLEQLLDTLIEAANMQLAIGQKLLESIEN